MPFITSTGAVSAIGFGLSYVRGETLYLFSSEAPAEWTTQADWYKDDQHTVAAGKFPTDKIATVLLSDGHADVETWAVPLSIDLNGHELTLEAHAVGEGCDPAVVINTEITNSQGASVELTLLGHVEVAA